MKKSIASNPKISHALLAMIFSILFIFTAIANTLIAHAEESSGATITQIPNINSRDANVDDVSTDQQAGYLYYAASGTRCGAMWYVTNTWGVIQASGILLDTSGQADYGDYAAYDDFENWVTFSYGIPGDYRNYNFDELVSRAKYEDSISTVYYSGGWKAKGIAVLNYLMEDTGIPFSINGIRQSAFPRWAKFVYDEPGGSEALKELAMPDCQWKVFIEPISVNYLYTNDHFDREVNNALYEDYRHCHFEAGSPIPLGEWVDDNTYKPTVYIGTGRSLLNASNAFLGSGGSDYTYKFYNMQLPYSLCLDNEVETRKFNGMGGYSITVEPIANNARPERLYNAIPETSGIGVASIDITGISLPPIHTFGGTTPGDTEYPDPDKGLNGECTIKKLYYTEVLNPDGTVKELTNFLPFDSTETTAYVSIDEEEGYEIELWKRSYDNVAFNHPSDIDDIRTCQRGTSSGIVRLQQVLTGSNSDKYLYILYKKVVVLDEEPSPYDFQLQESQITKRVTFLESTTTSSLITNAFSWTSPAHTTACQSHGGYGHHLNCTTVWDTAPVDGVPHTHTASCNLTCTSECAEKNHPLTPGLCPYTCWQEWDTEPVEGVAHTHTNACYDTPCTTFAFTDSKVKLGITLDQTSVNKAVVSKKWGITYDDTETNVVVDDTYFGEFTRTSPDANTIPKNNFNFVTVLFRGNDKLTLADWKNTSAAKSYLTNIAYDSNYNFKSANTPQGTRKAGEEYTETTSTKFINRSPDVKTTYKATVGAHGTCGSTKSYTFTKADGTSSDYTIKDIKVNIKVFWANGIGPSSTATLPSTQVAGSASFYPYIRMRYDNNTQNDKTVYVLGQRQRSATFYDYASVSISGGDSVITVNSNQWSIHAKAQVNILDQVEAPRGVYFFTHF